MQEQKKIKNLFIKCVFLLLFIILGSTFIYSSAYAKKPTYDPSRCPPTTDGQPFASYSETKTYDLGSQRACASGSCGNMWCKMQTQTCIVTSIPVCTPTGWSEKTYCEVSPKPATVPIYCDTSTCKAPTGSPAMCPIGSGGGGGGPSEYSILMTPGIRAISDSETTTYNIEIDPVAGMADGVVGLDVVGCPPGADCSFDQNSVTLDSTDPPPPVNVTLTVANNPTITNGQYYLNVTSTYVNSSGDSITKPAQSELDVGKLCTPISKPLGGVFTNDPTGANGGSTYHVNVDYGQKLDVTSSVLTNEISSPYGSSLASGAATPVCQFDSWVGATTVRYKCTAPGYYDSGNPKDNIYKMYTGVTDIPSAHDICGRPYDDIGFLTILPNLPSVSLSPSIQTIDKGSDAGLNWLISGLSAGDSCIASGPSDWASTFSSWAAANDPISNPASGSGIIHAITSDSTFFLSCTNSVGTSSNSADVKVNSPPPADTVTINANVAVIGGYVTSGEPVPFISCGAGRNPNLCSHTYIPGDHVELTAHSISPFWKFKGWESNPNTPTCAGGSTLATCGFNVTDSVSVSAGFSLTSPLYKQF